jgi:hypothetical protein
MICIHQRRSIFVVIHPHTINIDFQNRRKLWQVQLDELYQSCTFKHTKVSMHTVLYFIEICKALNCDQLYM